MKKVLFALAFLFTAQQLLAAIPEPFQEAVTFSSKLSLVGSGGGGGTLTINGEGTASSGSAPVNGGESDVGTVLLRPGKQYSATYIGSLNNPLGSTSGSYILNFTAPNGYRLYVNGVQADMCHDTISGPGTYVPFNIPLTLELRPLAERAPVSVGRFGGIELGQSISWDIGLGGIRSGNSAGRIRFKELDLTNNPASRDRLFYADPITNGEQIKVVWDDPVNRRPLQQIRVPQAIVDLADVTGDGYSMSFYAATPAALATWNGTEYTLAGQTAWRIVRVQSSGASQLKITETEGTTVRVSLLELTSGTIASGTYVLTLKEGDGTTWLRTTTHTSTNNGGSPATRDDVVAIYTGTATGTPAAKTKYRYTSQAWGTEEITQKLDYPTSGTTDANALTTTYWYGTDSAALGNYGRVTSIVEPTGKWTSYKYYDDWNNRGQLWIETHPFKDTPGTAQAADIAVGNSISYDYQADYSGRYRNEYNRTYYTKDTSSLQTGKMQTIASLDAANHITTYATSRYASATATPLLTTTAVFDPNHPNPDLANKVVSAKRPDQGQDSCAYYYVDATYARSASGTYLRTNVWHGTTNSAGATPLTAHDTQSVPSIYLIANKSTMDVIVQNPAGLVVRKETHVYTGGTSFSLLTSEDFTYDGAGRLTQSTASNGATIENRYANGVLEWTTDVAGTRTDFTFDLLGRVHTSVKKGAPASGSYAVQYDITTTYTYDGADHVTQTQVTDSSGSPLTLTSTAQYDLAGRLIQQVANSGSAYTLTTGFDYSAGPRIATANLPGGATKTSEVYIDGSLKSITGSAVVNEFMDYAVDSATGNRKTLHRSASASSPTLSTTTNDWLGRNVSIVQPGWIGGTITQTCSYNSYGQLYKCSQPGTADTLYTYDTLGGLVRQGLDVSGTAGTLDLTSSDRITERDWTYFPSGGNWYRRETNYVYATAGSGSPTYVGKVESQLSGLPAGRLAFAYGVDLYNNVTTSSTDVNRTGKLVTTTTARPNSTTYEIQTAYNGLLMSAQDTAGVTITYGYDTLGRSNKSTDPRAGSTTTSYFAGTSLVYQVKDPGNVVQATYDYDSAARVKTITNTLGKVANYKYNSRGQKTHEWGQTAYPVEYVYDPNYGRQTHLKTFAQSTATFVDPSVTAWPTTNVAYTFWEYEEATGLLKAKYDAANLDAAGAPIAGAKKVAYDYTAAGQPYHRTGQRGVITTYSYSPTTGELTGKVYTNDPASTPSVAYTYNRLGNISTVADATSGAGVRTFNYNLASTLELQSEDLPATYYSNRRLTYNYAPTGVTGRPTGLVLGTNATPSVVDQTVSYGYQTDGRLNTVAGNATGYTNYSFSYYYVTNSHMIRSVQQSTVAFATYRDFHANRDQLVYNANSVNGSNIATFQDWPDDLGRNAYATRWGAIFDRYQYTSPPTPPPGNVTSSPGLVTVNSYNDRSELTGDVTYLGWGLASAAGRSNGYVFDNLGNRKSTTHNGATAANYVLRSNGLNQYDHRDVPGTYDVAGSAVSTTVTVTPDTGGTMLRNGQAFFEGYPLPNSNPAYSLLTITAPSDTPSSYTQPAFLPATPEPFTYDDDGNLTRDGRWVYQYDAENRLIVMFTRGAPDDPLASNSTNVAVWNSGVAKQKLMFTYDYLGRRTAKVLAHYGTSSWLVDDNLRFIWNGWTMIEMLDANNGNAVLASYFWGIDLSGTAQGAGGVGGLLMAQGSFKNSDTGVTAATTLLPAHDCMGNIHAMIKASDGSIAAAYEYDNYGTTLRESGPYAASNPFRYSTKYTDVETGLVYYGQRYFSPSLGRFINQDPIQETGGLNLYAFCGNNGVNRWDYLGMKTITYKVKGYYTNGTTQTSNKPAAETYTSNTTEHEDEVTVEVPDEPINGRADLEGNGGDAFENLFRYGDPDGITFSMTLTDPGSGSKLTIVVHNASSGDIAQANHAMAETVATYNSQIGNPSSDSSATASGDGGSALGNALRHIPLVGGILGSAGDIVAGVGNTALGIVSLGQSGTLGRGLGQIGYGLGNTVDILGRDIAATGAGLVGTAYTTVRDVANLATFGQIDALGNSRGGVGPRVATGVFGALTRTVQDALIPEYGMFGGPNWGLDSVGKRQDLILNQGDVASYNHDDNLNEIQWIKTNYSTHPTSQWVGPVGAAYALLGTIPFGIKGLFDGEHYP